MEGVRGSEERRKSRKSLEGVRRGATRAQNQRSVGMSVARKSFDVVKGRLKRGENDGRASKGGGNQGRAWRNEKSGEKRKRRGEGEQKASVPQQ